MGHTENQAQDALQGPHGSMGDTQQRGSHGPISHEKIEQAEAAPAPCGAAVFAIRTVTTFIQSPNKNQHIWHTI